MIACGYVIDSIMFSMRIACVKEFALCSTRRRRGRAARSAGRGRPSSRRNPNITAERANCISDSIAIGGFSAFGKMRRRRKPVARAVIGLRDGKEGRTASVGEARSRRPTSFSPSPFRRALARRCARAPKGRIWRTSTGRVLTRLRSSFRWWG